MIYCPTLWDWIDSQHAFIITKKETDRYLKKYKCMYINFIYSFDEDDYVRKHVYVSNRLAYDSDYNIGYGAKIK